MLVQQELTAVGKTYIGHLGKTIGFEHPNLLVMLSVDMEKHLLECPLLAEPPDKGLQKMGVQIISQPFLYYPEPNQPKIIPGLNLSNKLKDPLPFSK